MKNTKETGAIMGAGLIILIYLRKKPTMYGAFLVQSTGL